MDEIYQKLAIFEEFKFDIEPVGVKFLPNKPTGLDRLNKTLDFCEMLPEAQSGNCFYVDKENFTCVGPLILGMVEGEPIFESGQVGPRLEVLRDIRANQRIYYVIPKIKRGMVNYVTFAPLKKLMFEPDVLIITANVSQAEILLRALSYDSGRIWSAKGTPVISCAWLFVYPYLSGEVNFTITGFGFGMRARKLFPEGLVLMAIPYDNLPRIVCNLSEMKWVPHSYTVSKDEHKKKVHNIIENIRKESEIL